MRVGVDTGGTFTDVVSEDGTVVKVPSTPSDPGLAVRSGVLSAVAGSPSLLAHGTTVATNALLERRGAAVGLVTTEGLADVIEIARQDRPSLYDPDAVRPEPLVPRAWRYEVGGRLAADGSELAPVPVDDGIPIIDPAVASVAVVLLHADLDPAHERAVAEVLAARGHDVTCSSDVSPEFREYERTVTTVVNAYLRPACRDYLRGLDGVADEVLVMTSAGGLVPASGAAELPVALLLSGPAGGVRAGAAVAAACGWADALTFDMGGTSTDVCLVRGGLPEPAPGREAAGFPIRLPSLDIRTIGAGGGSIARIDPGGALVVGPESAGAEPGPACYGRGGTRPTVTDADLVLGRILSGAELPGLGALDDRAARAALDDAGVTAEGVVAVVDEAMERALRQVSVAKGVDPSTLALVAFGGAGPLHACALADALGMPAVIVPPRAGVFSAVGLLCSPVAHDAVASWPTPSDHGGLAAALDALAADAAAAVAASARSTTQEGAGRAQSGGGRGAEVEVSTAVDCRYAGQSHELTVPTVADFEAEHRRRNGFTRPGAPIEVVALRARAVRPAPLEVVDLPAPPERTAAVGPAVIAEADCTIWVADGWRADPGPVGVLILTRVGT
ncbi:MAG TPA: hydantoinase/oxoprolinase family protein [Acidimicrobiales bacterium]|nr:hydantoinase/oxoprolinase family protein [Acidimicrobiales bacterium]